MLIGLYQDKLWKMAATVYLAIYERVTGEKIILPCLRGNNVSVGLASLRSSKIIIYTKLFFLDCTQINYRKFLIFDLKNISLSM